MCGRTSCSLCAERYESASSYFDGARNKYRKPSYKNCSSLEFEPSVNIAPTQNTPVLTWDVKEDGPVMQPMMWGLIPSWSENKSSKYSTHNCRIENMKTSALYKRPLKEGKRCVVLCEGYYEWPTADKTKYKLPHFIYNNQPMGMNAEEESDWSRGKWSEGEGWSGPTLMFLAGLYSIWQSPQNEIVPSYTIITMESTPVLSWLHHRMPAILTNQEEVRNWLNYEDVSEDEAVQNLTPVQSVSWHTVSSAVGNSRNKDSSCNKPVKSMNTGNQSVLTNWLKKPVKRESDSQQATFDCKKFKKENH